MERCLGVYNQLVGLCPAGAAPAAQYEVAVRPAIRSAYGPPSRIATTETSEGPPGGVISEKG